eukprot:TRINITY_DN53778_c0_g1_i2.p1 TRINITY_DN53778_c0_g1~~TRINITY_DN53778_c0_g1_i2.p1  ORF type:complete len:291 (-),score=-14.49 TRINITY_DN53778_c0_g1_i2:699-1571(-)
MGRSSRGSIRNTVVDVASHFFRMLNLVVLVGGIASIVVIFVIRPVPLISGWGFILLGVLTVVTGLLGAVSGGRSGCCFDCHMFGVFVSLVGLIASVCVIFLRLDAIVGNLKPTVDASKAAQLVRTEGAVYFVLFVTQLIALMLAAVVQCCGTPEADDDYNGKVTGRSSSRGYERAYDRDYDDPSPRRPCMRTEMAGPPSMRMYEKGRDGGASRWGAHKMATMPQGLPPTVNGMASSMTRMMAEKTARLTEQMQQKYAHWGHRQSEYDTEAAAAFLGPPGHAHGRGHPGRP